MDPNLRTDGPAPSAIAVIDQHIETCERALQLEQEMAAEAPAEREAEEQDRLQKLQTALKDAKQARTDLMRLVEKAQAVAAFRDGRALRTDIDELRAALAPFGDLS